MVAEVEAAGHLPEDIEPQDRPRAHHSSYPAIPYCFEELAEVGATEDIGPILDTNRRLFAVLKVAALVWYAWRHQKYHIKAHWRFLYSKRCV